MSNKKHTSVDWLAEKYDYITWMRNRDEISPAAADKWRKDFLEQAKEIHKEEIIETSKDSYIAGYLDNQCKVDDSMNFPEDYYNETFNTKEK